MLPTGLFHIRDTLLRRFLVALGVFSLAMAGAILTLHDWQPQESRLILLVPALFGATLLLLAWRLRGFTLRLTLAALLSLMATLPWLASELWKILGAGQG